jgi:asparagine synthase (glutamine-hydrolysing)
MCGICGITDPAGVLAGDLQTMIATLGHRGPDDEGLHVEGTVGLAHRRLSIIDLAGGHQPMASDDGTLHIVFNGEIYNYVALRAELARRRPLRTTSDTEVILRLYEDRGERCVDALRGMFAFAIWDARTRTLFLARDHLGQKPLFHVQLGARFAFASEIKALLALDPSLRELDPEALDQYLSLRILAPPRTMYRRVRKLPPGSTLTVRDGRATSARYWTLVYEPKLDRSEDDLLDELDARTQEAVRFHMVSDVPVGAFLSGGLDSGLVVAMMSRLHPRPVKTFAVGLDYGGHDELRYAALVAARYRTDHTAERMPARLLGRLPDLLWHLDEPADPLAACLDHVAGMAQREVKVVLGGDGGDELFGGYDRYYAQRYVAHWARLPVAVRRGIVAVLRGVIPDGFWYKSLRHRVQWLHDLSLAEGGQRYADSLGYFYVTRGLRPALYGEALLGVVRQADPYREIRTAFEADNADELVDRMLFADSMIRLPNHSVTILDRMTMAHGLEARSPFMDHRLAEFAARLPVRLKIRGLTRRYLQRRLAERYVPAAVQQRSKVGFSSALPYLLADQFRHLVSTVLADSHLARDGYLNATGVHALATAHLGRRADHGQRLWLIAMAELWYRMAIEGWPREKLRERLHDSPLAGRSGRAVGKELR